MNKRVEKRLTKLSVEVGKAMRNCTLDLQGLCDDFESSVEAMDALIDVMGHWQQRATWALVGSLAACTEAPPEALRDFIIQSAEFYRKDLFENMAERYREDFGVELFDVNAKVREEILNEI